MGRLGHHGQDDLVSRLGFKAYYLGFRVEGWGLRSQGQRDLLSRLTIGIAVFCFLQG